MRTTPKLELNLADKNMTYRENHHGAYDIEEGDEVALRTDQGVHIRGTCTKLSLQCAPSPDANAETRKWTIETESETFEFGIIERFQPTRKNPNHMPLSKAIENNDGKDPEDILGYITHIIFTEPTHDRMEGEK